MQIKNPVSRQGKRRWKERLLSTIYICKKFEDDHSFISSRNKETCAFTSSRWRGTDGRYQGSCQIAETFHERDGAVNHLNHG